MVTVDLAADGQKGLALSDGVELKSVTRDARSQHGPKGNPGIAFGTQSSKKGLVVRATHRWGRSLEVRASGADAGHQGANVASFGEGPSWETGDTG